MSPWAWLAVFVGGGAGACARAALGLQLKNLESGLPIATLLTNVTGCLFAGFLAERHAHGVLSELPRSLLLVGFCGGFTTFSAFAVENVQMLKSNHSLALGYFVLSAVGSIGAAALGMWISQCSR